MTAHLKEALTRKEAAQKRHSPNDDAPEFVQDEKPTLNHLAYGVDDGAEAIGMSKSWLWDQIKKGNVATFKFGRRTLIRVETLRDLINQAA